jgi:hypothetical protein
MNIPSLLKPMPAGARRARRTRAFTVAEMMVAVFIFVFMVLGIIYVWMFALRYDELVCSKLGGRWAVAPTMAPPSFSQPAAMPRTRLAMR